jgi:rsbT antagonist protein RsbS
MRTPVLQQGDVFVVALHESMDDAELEALRGDLAARVGRVRAAGLVIDVSALDVMDSFATRTLLGIAKVAELRGADSVIVGIQPDVAFAMVQLGLTLEGVHTALDLEEGLALLAARKKRRTGA